MQNTTRIGRLDVLDHAQVLHLWVGEDLVDAVDRPAGNAGRVLARHPLPAGAIGKIGLDLGVERIPVLGTRSRLRVLGLLHHRFGTDDAAKSFPGGRAGRRDVDVAVARLEGPRGYAGWMVVAGLA